MGFLCLKVKKDASMTRNAADHAESYVSCSRHHRRGQATLRTSFAGAGLQQQGHACRCKIINIPKVHKSTHFT